MLPYRTAAAAGGGGGEAVEDSTGGAGEQEERKVKRSKLKRWRMCLKTDKEDVGEKDERGILRNWQGW